MGMKITGTAGLTTAQVRDEVQRGARFVIYQYCISVLVMSFRRSSDIVFVRAGHSRAARGWGYTVVSLVAGWWGIPWGPIWTISTTFKNLAGGIDVTEDVMRQVAPAVSAEPPLRAAS